MQFFLYNLYGGCVGEKCMHLFMHLHYSGKWNDIDCNEKLYFLCEINE